MPLLNLEVFDEASQIKFYAKTYYSIIFSEFELNSLNMETPLKDQAYGIESLKNYNH